MAQLPIPLSSLRAFEAAARTGSFRAAAEDLRLTPSAVSHAIRGLERSLGVALLAATGAQTETIPPSLVLITIGAVTGVSIAALFTGGMLPGVVLGATLCALVWWRNRGKDLSHVQRVTRREIGRAFVIATPAVACHS
jgi:TRAP-type C4-dicarboxylate transport system permease large subunit